jgi:copper chaperone CopZ
MADEKTYTVTGMTCGHCEMTVREQVAEVPGVESVEADRSAGRLTVRGTNVDESAVRRAVTEAGYGVAT